MFEDTDASFTTTAQEYTTSSSILRIKELLTAFDALYHQSPLGWTWEAHLAALGPGLKTRNTRTLFE